MGDQECPDMGATSEMVQADLVRRLPELLRSRCCKPTEPWVGETDQPMGHDHGHTDCLFMNLAADEIERLRGLG